MSEKGKLFLIGKCRLISIEKNEGIRKSLTGNLYSNNCFRQEWSMNAKISKQKWVKHRILI